VKCWGTNYAGQLGDGTTTRRPSPVDVLGLPAAAVRVSAGNDHTCAVVASGEIYCWGSNQFGKLGDGSAEGENCTGIPCEPSPVPVTALGDAVDVSAGDHVTCAISRSGAVLCWGLSSFGALGNGSIEGQPCGSFACRPAPGSVDGIADVRAIAAGDDHVCALQGDGSVFCWGDNEYGQLGQGTIATAEPWGSPSPARASLDASLRGVTSGSRHVCVRSADDRISCWGETGLGQLGDGTVGQACALGECNPVPVDVPLSCR
jgi:alpha-tubulin suppressor-like RCC1 family protein